MVLTCVVVACIEVIDTEVNVSRPTERGIICLNLFV